MVLSHTGNISGKYYTLKIFHIIFCIITIYTFHCNSSNDCEDPYHRVMSDCLSILSIVGFTVIAAKETPAKEHKEQTNIKGAIIDGFFFLLVQITCKICTT